MAIFFDKTFRIPKIFNHSSNTSVTIALSCISVILPGFDLFLETAYLVRRHLPKVGVVGGVTSAPILLITKRLGGRQSRIYAVTHTELRKEA